MATRFTLPVRALALSASGLNLAAGGDDEGLKLVDVESYRVFRQLKSQVGAARSGGGDGGASVWVGVPQQAGWKSFAGVWLLRLPLLHPPRPSSPSCPHLAQAYTRSLAWDPESVYLGSVNGDGTLNVWEVESGKQALCRRKACPKVRRSVAGGWGGAGGVGGCGRGSGV